MDEPQLDLPARAQDFCIGSVADAVAIRRVERLRGGIDAVTHLVELALESGSTREVIVRRWVRERKQPWPPIEQEMATLRAFDGKLSSATFSVPSVLAHDASGSQCDVPAMLLTRVPGRIDLSPNTASLHVPQLARALATLHAAPVACPAALGAFDFDWKRREKRVPDEIVAPNWTRAWRALESLSPDGEALIHGDFHIGNALFSNGHLSGIVDWTLAHRGPSAFDVGYCRTDLSMVFGLEEADLFLSEYEVASGRSVPQMTYWDLAGAVRAFPDPAMWLPGWLDAGRSDLSADLIRERLNVFVDRCLARL
jgi:aminoglycoside phosphotransferase (APT) family kinase protein